MSLFNDLCHAATKESSNFERPALPQLSQKEQAKWLCRQMQKRNLSERDRLWKSYQLGKLVKDMELGDRHFATTLRHYLGAKKKETFYSTARRVHRLFSIWGEEIIGNVEEVGVTKIKRMKTGDFERLLELSSQELAGEGEDNVTLQLGHLLEIDNYDWMNVLAGM